MTNNYSPFDTTENSEYEKYLLASRFQPDDAFTTDPGSGYMPNSQLVRASAGKPWPVSRRGGQLQHITIKAAGYGSWKADALEAPKDTYQEQVLTTKDKLENIRDIFGLSISHLAKAFCVSRPSLHSWLEGSEPRDQSIERIDHIHQTARTWKKMSPFHNSPGRLMRQPLGDGVSMLERLQRAILDSAEIQDGLEKLSILMHRQREQMDRSKQRSTNSTHPDKVKVSTRHRLTKTIVSPSK